MKIVVPFKLQTQHVQEIHKIVPDAEVINDKDSSVWTPHLTDAEIIVAWRQAFKSVISENDTKLRWVQLWSAGVDNVPMDLLHQKGIIVTNASGVHPYPISETIFGMMLTFTRKLNIYIKQQMNKTWNHSKLRSEMHGRTIGIIGVGAIGEETAKIAKAFGMTVLGVRRSRKPSAYVDRMSDPGQLNELLPECDYVINLLPLTEDTHHIFRLQQFQQMKPTAFFINVGRGPTVHTEDLLTALEQNEIAGAGLDVFEKEPLPEDHPLWEMDNVIITPHVAGSTEFYEQRVMGIFLANLQQYVRGQSLSHNRVDEEQKY